VHICTTHTLQKQTQGTNQKKIPIQPESPTESELKKAEQGKTKHKKTANQQNTIFPIEHSPPQDAIPSTLGVKDKAHRNKRYSQKKKSTKGGGQKRRKTIRTIKSYHSQSQR
jgi:hypothetical protein